MKASVVGLQGGLAGKSFAIGSAPVTFGRGEENDVVISRPRGLPATRGKPGRRPTGTSLADLGEQ